MYRSLLFFRLKFDKQCGFKRQRLFLIFRSIQGAENNGSMFTIYERTRQHIYRTTTIATGSLRFNKWCEILARKTLRKCKTDEILWVWIQIQIQEFFFTFQHCEITLFVNIPESKFSPGDHQSMPFYGSRMFLEKHFLLVSRRFKYSECFLDVVVVYGPNAAVFRTSIVGGRYVM